MNFKANYEIVPLSSGLNTIPAEETSIHQVYCIAAGSVKIIAAGGGSATFILTANEKVDVVTKSVEVSGGAFIGFRANL